MDLSKIKIVVSDMDGTLLNKNNDVSPRFFQQFEELKKLDIHFVAASGRQYHSIIDKLSAIKNDISVIAENGGMLQYDNETKVLLKLTPDQVKESVEILRTLKDCFIVLCGKKGAYIESSNEEFIGQLKKYYTNFQKVDDLTKLADDEFLKIAVFNHESSESFIYPHVEHLKDHYKIIVSGQNWLDISHIDSNKGYALKMLQDKLGVAPHETLVFGDYNNDIEMLELSDFSFAMENAHPDVKQRAKFSTKSNSDHGVEDILEKLINVKRTIT